MNLGNKMIILASVFFKETTLALKGDKENDSWNDS